MTIEYLKNCDTNKILKKLCKHSDPIVRESLLYNIYAIPKKYLEILLNDEDMDIQEKVCENLTKKSQLRVIC